ncbi:MAG TPA: bifunctional demethylmenaquinone methyltransferase/2-methoxy-6-polyprenyl-1,4-benzoquinol methylase UbiE [Terriglobia bacterium]|nr:bifunctional demethylmenaquinone methyltransferase/2-methoxy-6-polyprenyl-1,4-benzoquinol methylase UbiE [Terriglobia bacterium]
MEQKGSPLGAPGQVQETARAVQTMFARVAPRYDFLNHLLSARLDVQWRRAAAVQLRPILERPGSVAADVCCGTGDLTFALARFSAGRVLGADFCHPMLVIARAKRAGATGGSAQRAGFIEADTLSLPLRDNALDLVSAAFGFRNLADYGRGLSEMHRVLRPGGVIAILEFSRVQWPVVGPLFRFYFRRVLPLVGTLISRVPGAYQYLPESVARFPDQESLARSLREAGFAKVRYRNFFGGVAALHWGEKNAQGRQVS